MSCLGVYFALSDRDVAALLSKASDHERLAFINEDIEPCYVLDQPEYVAECDKSWDAMHRALSDGYLSEDGGDYPANHVVIGGTRIYEGDDYIMSLKTPQQVKDIASALAAISEEAFRTRYNAIDAADYGVELDEGDFQYTWNWFEHVKKLFQVAAAANRSVLFTADQ